MTKNVTNRTIKFDDYPECLFSRKEQHRKMNVIRSHCYDIYSEEINNIALSHDDDKRVIMADGIHTLAYGHTQLKKIAFKKMRYNEMPNILVDSVVLPNKPLSNLEILDGAKRLSVNEFRGVFLRDTLPKEAKLNECCILNLDSSSGGLCSSKKVRITSMSIVMVSSLLVS